jgi:hypothetical protein
VAALKLGNDKPSAQHQPRAEGRAAAGDEFGDIQRLGQRVHQDQPGGLRHHAHHRVVAHQRAGMRCGGGACCAAAAGMQQDDGFGRRRRAHREAQQARRVAEMLRDNHDGGRLFIRDHVFEIILHAAERLVPRRDGEGQRHVARMQ